VPGRIYVGTVFLRRRNVCQCDVEAAIANQLHDQVDHAPVRQQQQLAVGSMKLLQLSFMILVGEELTEFGFVREECENNFENH